MKVTPKFYHSDDLQVSYLHIPKCGCSSIQHMIRAKETRCSEFPEYESFTILRNPKDRILSGYHELRKRGLFKGTFLEMMQEIKRGGFFNTHIVPQKDYWKEVDRVFIFPRGFGEVAEWLGIREEHRNQRQDNHGEWCEDSEKIFQEVYAEEIEWYKMVTNGN